MIIAGNWKMNCDSKQAINLVHEIIESNEIPIEANVIIFPPSILIPVIFPLIKNTTIKLGAQDCSLNDNGAYTGQISSDMILDAGCEYVILGHSERRSMCHETSSDVSLKSFKAISKGLNVIICIGESLKEREDNSYLSILENQLSSSLPKSIGAKLEINDFQITIAYEPIWAIGSGKVATSENIVEVHKFIKNCLNDYFGSPIKIPVIYGGSVNANNSIQILKLNSVDGVLVGGASLKSDDFIKIVKNSL